MRGMRSHRYAAVLLLLLVPALVSRAQEDPTPAAAGAPLYEVELIAFRHLDQHGNTPEAAAPVAGTGDAALAPPDAGTTPAGDSGYPPLPARELRLGGIAAKLRRGGPYELVFHGGWVQGIAGQRQAQPTPLPHDAVDAGVGGSITLYRERYLHALVDVGLLRDPGGSTRIHQGRRIRGQTIHYFDHPRFGVILAVRPINGATAEEPADEAAPP